MRRVELGKSFSPQAVEIVFESRSEVECIHNFLEMSVARSGGWSGHMLLFAERLQKVLKEILEETETEGE